MPRVVSALVLAVALAGCAPIYVDGRNIDGTSWIAVSVAGRQPFADHVPTLRFDGGRVRGFAGCNSFGSESGVTVTNQRLVLPEQVLVTLAGCAGENGEAINEMERTFWTALTISDRIDLRGEQLVISGPNGELVFDRAP